MPGLSSHRHDEIRAELDLIRERLVEIDSEVSNAYGKTNRPYGQDVAVAIRRIVFVRAKMEIQAVVDMKDSESGGGK